MDHNKVKRLLQWLSDNGGSIQPGVEIIHHEATGYCIQTRHDFEMTKPIVHVPKSLTISVSNVSSAQSKWPQTFLDLYAKESYIITRFLLVDEFLHGPSSWWWPYLDLLPSPSDDPQNPPFSTPLWFSDQDLKWLQGTGLENATKQRQEQWRKEYDEGYKYLSDLAKHSDYSWTLYKWAATVLSSRCFPSKAPAKSTALQLASNVEGLDTDNGEALYPVLVPVLDLANHNPTAKVTWIINENGYTLFTGEQYNEVAEQIFNNYGPKGNEELLIGYGFVIPDNPADSLRLSFSLSESPQKLRAQSIVKSGKKFPLCLTSAQLGLIEHRLTEFTPNPHVFFLQIEKPIPPALLDSLRLDSANERELKDFCDGLDQSSHRLAVQAKGQLLFALLLRSDNIQASIALSGIETRNAHQILSQIYVSGQSRILDHHVRLLLEGFDEVQETCQIWTLDDIFHSSPENIKLPLRHLARAVCGTRNPSKLRGKGLEDVFMIIFVCLNWFLATKKSAISEDLLKDSHLDQIEERFARWHDFIRATYCPPPSDLLQGECKAVNCFCTSSKQINHPWTLWETSANLLSEFEPRISNALAIVQKGFILQELYPIFGTSETWTKPFLYWALGIWNAEGVIIPERLMDKNDDTHIGMTDFVQQKAIYLEVLIDTSEK